MYTSAVLLSALAATVSATLQPVRIPYPKRIEARQTADDSDYTDFATGTADASFPSSTEDPACSAAIDSIYSVAADMPEPPEDVESYLYTATATDFCASSVPTSLSADFASWSSDVLDWYSSTASAALSSAVAECPDLTDGDDDYTDLGFCTDDAGVAAATGASGSTGGLASATATATGADKTDGSSASSTATETAKKGSSTTATSATGTGASSSASASSVHTAGAVAREVGVVGAVIAGVLGAVAAL